MNEREFGHQIKKQLDATLDLEPAALDRLKIAREQALARQRLTRPVFALAWADAAMGRLSGNHASVSIALGAGALILALVGVQYWQRSPTVEEIADIDTALLSGDLPINAYLDKSFDTWLKH
jgi:hypothetical protein